MITFGFHYFPDETHYREADLLAWLPELNALGARWLTLVGSHTRAIPERFIRGVLEAGIQPIVHIPAGPIDRHRLDLQPLALLFQTYARWGVQYVVLFSEPNMRAAWPPAEWGKPALVERFLDTLIPVLAAQAEAGLQPTFPPLRAGGDYWDTAFLEAALAGLAQRGQASADLARQLTFAVNLWSFNRPADWGAGGLRRWPDSKPYLTPSGSQDQRGFRLGDWYNEIIEDRLKVRRPLLCLAGGPTLGDQSDPVFPPVDGARHGSCILEIMQAASEGALPANLLNINFWLLAAPESSPFARHAWYQPNGSTLNAVDVAKRMAAMGHRAEHRSRNESKALKLEHIPLGEAKALRHYLLLPTFEWGVSEWHWDTALDYVKTFRPACGFSPEEAAQAQQVTIFGNEQGVSGEVEAALRQAGCTVERIVVSGGEKHF